MCTMETIASTPQYFHLLWLYTVKLVPVNNGDLKVLLNSTTELY